jgi:hypothetical protein
VSDDDSLFATVWVHLFEEDTAEGAIYGPEHEARLSRRPRERLKLEKDGSARIYVAGPDDRPVGRPAAWSKDGGDLVVRPRDGRSRLRVHRQALSRLIVRTETTSGSDGGSRDDRKG